MSNSPGWHQDPHGRPGQLRWWDGRRWTERVAQADVSSSSPPAIRPTTARDWIDRHPAAFVGVIVAVLTFGCCGFFGVLAVFIPTENESTSARDRGDDTSPDHEEAKEEAQPKEAAEAPTSSEPEPEPRPEERKYVVVRVIDGDTIELDSGDDVRLIGMDAPEDGTCGSARATAKLTAMLEGRRVTLERAGDNRDKYDRLLRYVDRGNLDVGLAMIESGLAIARYDSRDGYGEHPRERAYIRADRSAANVKCAPPPPPPPPKPTKPPKQFVDPPSNCEPGYSPCVPTYPPDLDCADTGPVVVTGPDPHGLDADNDGVACGGD